MGNFKHNLFYQFAGVVKAITDGYQLDLRELPAPGERSVDAFSQVPGLTMANTSQHLQQLRQSGLVSNRKSGHKVFNPLSGMDVAALLGSLLEVAEYRLIEVNRLVDDYLTLRDSLEPAPAIELMEKSREDLLTVLDVRPDEEFVSGHLPGAINIPLRDLETHQDKLNPNQEIVIYCNGPHCAFVFDAVDKRRKKA